MKDLARTTLPVLMHQRAGGVIVRTSRAIAILMCLGGGSHAYSQPQTSTFADSERVNTNEDVQIIEAGAVLADGAASDAQRLAAAKYLVRKTTWPVAMSVIDEELSEPLSGSSGAMYLLQALAQASAADDQLFPILVKRFQRAASDELPRLLNSLGCFRSRAAARLALTYTNGDVDAETAAAAFGALNRMSGKDEFGSDAQEWSAWLSAADSFTESQWQNSLIESLAAQAERERLKRREAVVELSDIYRRLHVATPAQDRSPLLISMLKSPLVEVRDLGFELIQREVSETGRLDERVGDAAVGLLLDSNPKVRGLAAVLIRQVAPPSAAGVIVTALDRESDPRAASDLLLAATRWPSRDSVAAVLKWLERESDAQDAAIEACLQFSKAGELSSEESQRVLGVIRTRSLKTLTPAGVSLLIELGDKADRDAALPLLTAPAPAIRTATGESLLWYSEYQDQIIAAAQSHDDLMPVAARAVMVHTPDAARFRAVAALPATTSEARLNALLLLASVMPATQVLEALLDPKIEDPLRSGLLATLTSPTRVMSEGVMPKNLAAIKQGILLSAMDDLNRGDSVGALAVLDTPVFSEDSKESADAGAIRLSALLGLGRISEAQRVGALNDYPLQAYLRGYELAKSSSYAPDVARFILGRYATGLDESQVAMLQRAIKVSNGINSTGKEELVVGPPAPVTDPTTTLLPTGFPAQSSAPAPVQSPK